MTAYEWGSLVGGMLIPAALSGAAIWLGFRARKQGRNPLLFWLLGGALGALLLAAVVNAATG